MKLLLIEDEQEMANFLTRGLKYEGYRVDHLEDGVGILRHLKQNSYDMIILDLILPFVSGEKLLEEIRSSNNGIPVIVLTALDEVETKAKLFDLGADDYLVKPFSFIELIARIKSVTRRSQGGVQASSQLVVGDLMVDHSTRKVTRAGKEIKLRLKEYALLEYLMENPDKVVNRNALIENVWDYNATLFSNTVDSHISLLRKKINKGFDRKLIETVHGFGYILKSK